MSKTLLVAWREFLATVLTKGFLIGIILPPVIMAFSFTLIPLLMNSASPKTVGVIAVIDRSGLAGDAVKENLSPAKFKERAEAKMKKMQEKVRSRITLPNDPRTQAANGMAEQVMAASAPKLDVEVLPEGANPEDEKKPILQAHVRDTDEANPRQRIALVVIPPEAVTMPAAPAGDKPAEYAHYQLFTAPKLDIEVRQEISDQLDRAIVDARLRAAKLDPAQVRALTAEPITDTKVVTAEGERSENGAAQFLLPVGFMMLLWVSVLVGGQGLLQSTIEEKSSRIMEVLLSAVSPMQLMVGKIVGQMAVASLILGLYAGSGVGALVFFSMNHLLDPMVLVYAVLYFVVAFFLMASMMAAIGSVVNDMREAQVLMQPIMIVMVIPMVLWLPISRNPNGAFAQVLSFIPPASPFVMVIRLAGSERIPFWQIPATLAVGAAAMLFMCWATAKIFRIGVLMYGKPPNFRTLVRWVRMA